MKDFARYEQYVTTYPDSQYDLSQLIARNTGKGRHRGYTPPNPTTRNQAINLLKALQKFDDNPSQLTLTQVNTAINSLGMKCQRVDGQNEWLYICPINEDASKRVQFTLGWHVGSKSKVAVSDEHNGSDGAYRVVGAIAKQSDIKFVISNARHQEATTKKSSYQRSKQQSNWSHSGQTIAAPLFNYVRTAYPGIAIVNVHGMTTKGQVRALLVNNWNNQFTKGQSYPTLLAIALAKRFTDRTINIGSDLPGFIVVNGERRQLTNTNNKNSPVFVRAPKTPHNTNYIGRKVINRNRDSGNSCHIEFDARLLQGGPGLQLFMAAMAEADYWYNNYIDAIHNPWNLKTTNPAIFNDMSRYSELFPTPSKELAVVFAGFFAPISDVLDPIPFDLADNVPSYEFELEDTTDPILNDNATDDIDDSTLDLDTVDEPHIASTVPENTTPSRKRARME